MCRLTREFGFSRVCSSLSLLVGCALLLVAEGRAQMEPTPYEGRTIRSLTYSSDGPILRISEGDLLKLIALEEGAPFSYSAARYTIAQLFSTELFFDVQIDVREAGDDAVDVEILLIRRYIIQTISFDGDVELNEREIRRELAFREGEPFFEENQATTLSRLGELYRRQGYYGAEIRPVYELDERLARLKLIYEVDSGPRARVRSLELEVEGEIAEDELRQELELEVGDEFSQVRLEEAISQLKSFLSLEGFFQAEVYIPEGVEYEEASNSADIRVRVVTHERTRIEFEGLELDRKARLSLPLFQEGTARQLLFQQTVEVLESNLQEEGYFLAEVAADVRETREGLPFHVVFTIDRGRKYDLKRFLFEGDHGEDPDQLERLLISERAGLFSRGRFTDSTLESDKERLRFYFQRQGYRDVEVSHEFETSDENLIIVYRIERGPRYYVAELNITGNSNLSSEVLREQIELTEGQPFSAYAVTADRANLIAVYQNRGYQDVQFESNIEYGDEQAVTLTYRLEEGIQYFVDKVLVVGALETKRGVIEDQILVHPGEPYSFERNLQSETNLYDLAIFNRVSVRPIPSYDQEAEQSVLFRVDEAKKYTLLYGVGYSHTFGGVSSEGARGTFGVTNSNFLGRASTLSTSIRAGRRRQRGNISYNLREPFGYNLPTVLSLTADNEKRIEETEGELISVRGRPFDSFRFGVSSQSEKVLSRRESMFFRYNFERVLLNVPDDLAAPIEFFRAQENLRLSSVSVSYLNESRNEPADPTQGFFLNGDLKVPAKFLGSEAQFFRFVAQGQYYYPLYPDLTVAAVLRVGFIEPFGKQDETLSNPVPISERFFAGGGSTIRSVPLDLAGPLLRDENGELILVKPGKDRDLVPVPLGGNVLLVGNLELRFPLFGIFSGALFTDAGNVFEDFAAVPNSTYYHGVGFGVSIDTPVGPIRLDAAYNPNPRDIPGFKQWLFHFNLGQPF